MSDATIAELIRNLPNIITAIGVIVVGYWAYKSKTQSQTNNAMLNTVNQKVNGMTQELVEATKAAASAEGQLEGREAERVHHESAAPIVAVTVGPTGASDDPIHVETGEK